nr:hypothetical protein [Tanacetum cinerariifolium]
STAGVDVVLLDVEVVTKSAQTQGVDRVNLVNTELTREIPTIISGLPPFSAITPDEPVLSTEEPNNSLSMGDEHLDTIFTTESDEFIKSGVETLIRIPKFSSIDDDSFSIDDIDYVEASPPDSELVSSEVTVSGVQGSTKRAFFNRVTRIKMIAE